MDQNEKEANRKAIQAKREQDQDNALSGIVDNETKRYTFERTIQTTDGEKTGSFTAKVMTVMDRLRLGSTRAKLLNGAPAESLDGLTDDIAYMIAFLQVSLVKSPEWFDFSVMDDEQDLYRMFYEVKAFQDRFRNHNGAGSNAGDSSAASSKKTMESE